MIVQYLFILTTLSLFLARCSEKEADLEMVDSLITIGDYVQAGKILQTFELETYSDTIQVKRIKNRFRILDRKKYFAHADKLIEKRKWDKALNNLDELKNKINKIDKKEKSSYYFDYFFRLSVVDSALKGQDEAIKSMENALEYSTSEHKTLWVIYEKLAFYYAENDKMVKARENLDKALRKTDLNIIDPGLKKVFSLYMNGDFLKAKQLIINISDSVKDNHWKTTQLFLEKYGDKLTMEERFKLW